MVIWRLNGSSPVWYMKPFALQIVGVITLEGCKPSRFLFTVYNGWAGVTATTWLWFCSIFA